MEKTKLTGSIGPNIRAESREWHGVGAMPGCRDKDGNFQAFPNQYLISFNSH